MKNSKEYSKKIASLYQSLKRKSNKVQKPEPESVVESLIYGIVSEKLSEKDTESALKKFNEYFVDFNDLRVSRPEEIAEILGEDNSENREIGTSITKVLNRIFNESHQIDLEILHKLGKRPARQKLEKMEELSRFAVNYCMLVSLDSHAIPVTETMIEYLKCNDLIDADADKQTVDGFLAKQISAKNGYEFYKLLRHESEANRKQTKSTKAQAAKKAAKTAAAKKVKKVAKAPAATKTKRKK